MTDGESMRDAGRLRRHAFDVLDFYLPACVDDEHGGFAFQVDAETGAVTDRDARHLVASARGVHNYSLGVLLDGPAQYRDAARHGLDFLLEAHRDDEHGGFHWLLDGRTPVDSTKYAYGHAFVVLACATAARAGVADEAVVHDAVDVLVDRFWERDVDLCRAEASRDWSFEPYRGQNANMHACEAFLAAFEATGRPGYRRRAALLAEGVVVDLAAETDGRVWEHYDADWTPDFAYNRDRPRDTFRPWGFQPGHHAEWAKLCCLLAPHVDADWPVDRAVDLFEYAVSAGWRDGRGGFAYTVDRDDEPFVETAFGWPVAEAIGAAALLADRTGDDAYWTWYDRCWSFADARLVNEQFGNWFTVARGEDEPRETASEPAVEPGYHPVTNATAAYRVLSAD